MNFNDHMVTWDTDTIPMKDSDNSTLSSLEALNEVYMIANEPQTLRDEYSQATKILDAEYKQTSSRFDNVIKTCENLYIEEQHQLKILLQKYEHLLDGTLGEFNMEPISLELMDTNCKPIHAHVCAYTVPRSVEQQLQQCKEIVRLVDIGVLEYDYSSE
jgi:glutamyl/glutaminyl-tRNA synthetase